MLKTHADLKLEVAGHTDNTYSDRVGLAASSRLQTKFAPVSGSLGYHGVQLPKPTCRPISRSHLSDLATHGQVMATAISSHRLNENSLPASNHDSLGLVRNTRSAADLGKVTSHYRRAP